MHVHVHVGKFSDPTLSTFLGKWSESESSSPKDRAFLGVSGQTGIDPIWQGAMLSAYLPVPAAAICWKSMGSPCEHVGLLRSAS